MKSMILAQRSAKEMLRDPATLLFGAGLPVGLICLFAAIGANVPAEAAAQFSTARIAPGMTVFGFAFLSLFGGMLLARDRKGAFLMRLFAAPLRAADYILGYTLPLAGIGLAQTVLCMAAAVALGVPLRASWLMGLVAALPSILLFIGLGLLLGSVLSDKAVGGICGAGLTNAAALAGGIWFDPAMVGGAYEKVCNALPFIHGVKAMRAAMQGEWNGMGADIGWVLGYAAVVLVLAVIAFRAQMHKQ